MTRKNNTSNGLPARTLRKTEAANRAAVVDGMGREKRLERLDDRLGAGVGAVKERARRKAKKS